MNKLTNAVEEHIRNDRAILIVESNSDILKGLIKRLHVPYQVLNLSNDEIWTMINAPMCRKGELDDLYKALADYFDIDSKRVYLMPSILDRYFTENEATKLSDVIEPLYSSLADRLVCDKWKNDYGKYGFEAYDLWMG